jgi:hypothetical protein
MPLPEAVASIIWLRDDRLCTPVGCRSPGGSSPRWETFVPGFRLRVTSVELRFSARSGIGVAALQFLEIVRDDQLECQAV